MKSTIIRNALAASVFAALVGSGASADDQTKTAGPKTPDTTSDTSDTDVGKTTDAKTDMKSADAKDKKEKTSDVKDVKQVAPKLGTAEVMKITQTAMTHIAAADRALAQGHKKAAKTALAKSEKELAKLYNNPALGPVMSELDKAIDSVEGKSANLDGVDLAPLSTTIRTYQAYLDPSVAAGIERARKSAEGGDASSTADALRLARNRVAIDAAFIPVEDAYIRVIAAQHALEKGNTKQASRLLDNVPVIVTELQVSQPLLPIRFKLNAAAEAAESENWDQAETLLSQVDDDLQQLEKISTADKQAMTELSSISDEAERLHQNAIAGRNPAPGQIRQLAQRVQTFGMDDTDVDTQQPMQDKPMQREDGMNGAKPMQPDRAEGT